jgi:hypothetical protein
MDTGEKVERSLDRKIRVLRWLLETPTHEELDEDGMGCIKHADTYKIGVPHMSLMSILHDLRVTIVDYSKIPLYDNGDPVDGRWTNDYVLDVSIEKEDADRLSALLKGYEKQLPKRKRPAIREKALELIAKKIGDIDTEDNLIKFLKSCGVDEEMIIPNTKWLMVFNVMTYLASSDKKSDKDALGKIIGGATHPLMHEGNEGSALVLRKQFDEYLKYDNMGIAYDEKDGSYQALRNADDEEVGIQLQEEADEALSSYEEHREQQLLFLSRPENKEKISMLRKIYQSLMNVIFAFCENPAHPTVELNQDFQSLSRLINKIKDDLELSKVDRGPLSRNEHFFILPFYNLFSAEKVCQEQDEELNWQRIRPEMYAMYGDIEDLYREVNGGDVIAEPEIQKKLDEIQNHLSVLRKEREAARTAVRQRIQARAQNHSTIAAKIEITSLPEVRIKKEEGDAILKNTKGKSFPFNLPRGTKWEHFTIQFLDKEKVRITVKGRECETNFTDMGFDDRRNGKPNQQWALLLILARRGGELAWKDSEAKKKYKKTVQLLADGLSAYFTQIDKDPFWPYEDIDPSEKPYRSYKIKLKLIPPTNTDGIPEPEDKDELGIHAELNKFNS